MKFPPFDFCGFQTGIRFISFKYINKSFNLHRQYKSNHLHSNMRNAVLIFLLVSALVVFAQNEKPGSCPPPLSVDICFSTCEEDLHCRGSNKCCPTECGGTFCVEPIAMRAEKQYKGTYLCKKDIFKSYFSLLPKVVYLICRFLFRETWLLSIKSHRTLGLHQQMRC